MACTGGPPAALESADSAVVALPADVGTLLPLLSRSASEDWVLDTFAWPLLRSGFDCAPIWTPGVAVSWTVAPDGRSVRLSLRPGLTWEDGAPVTARDVAFSFDLATDPAVGSRLAGRLQGLDPVARPLVLGDLDVEFRFLAPRTADAALAVLASVPVLPRHVLAGANRAALEHHFANERPLLCGPWSVARWTRGDALVLEPNDRFTGPTEDTPRLTGVTFRVLPDRDTRIRELEAGGVDVVRDLLVSDADELARSHPEIALRRRGWRTLEFVGWNLAHPLFGDPIVRRALAAAVDRDRLIAEVLTSEVTGERYGRPAVGPISPSLCTLHADGLSPVPFDPTAARAGLEAAGWTRPEAQGVLERRGRPFRFHLLLPTGTPRRDAAAARLQADLATVGVDVVLEPVPAAVFQARLKEGDFDAFLGAWAASLEPDLADTWHSGPDRTFNFIGYANPEVDAILDAVPSEPDPARAAAAWQRFQVVVHEDQPYAFLYWADEIVAVHERFRDVRVDVDDPWGDLERWWVPPEEVRRRSGDDVTP